MGPVQKPGLETRRAIFWYTKGSEGPMSDKAPMPPAAPRERSVMPDSRDPTSYLWGLMGLGLIAYGCYQFYLAQTITAFGSFIALAGITMMPWSIVSLIGGVGLLAWAAWWTFTVAKYPMDYLYTLIAVVFGLTAIFDRVKTLRRKR